MKLQYFRSRRVQIVLVGLIVFLFFSGCINPFSGNDDRDSAPGASGDGGRYGSIVINPGGGITAQTVAPDISNLKSLIDSYNVTLTNTSPGSLAPITVNGYVEGNSIDNVPYGTWDISLVGTSGGTQIATASVTGFVVAAATNPVTMDLRPSTIGNGTLDYTLSFPASDVDGATVTLDPWPVGGGDEVTLTSGTDYNADYGTTGSLAISGTYASNVYLMTIQLSDSTASGNGNHAPVVKIVQIFDELATTGSDTITIAELRSPPAAPTNMVVEFTGENAFSVSWTDASNTEQGFRVYDDPAAATPLADITNGSGIATGLSDAGYTPGIAEDVTYRVVAYNQFGESLPLDFSFRVLPTAQMPSHTLGAANLGPGWVAASAPGALDWATLIVGGGTGLNIYTSTTNDLTDVTNLPPATASGPAPPWNLTNIGGLTPLETYNWRFEAVDGTNRVFFPAQQFTVRDGILYVSAANTGGVDGSETDPVAALGAAIGAALDGEEVRVSVGSYTDGFAFPTGERLTVTGGWPNDFSAGRNTARDQDSINPLNSQTVNDTLVSVIDYSANGNSISVNSGAGLGTPSVLDGFYIQNATGTLMTVSNTDIDIRNNVFVTYVNGNTNTSSTIMSVSGSLGATSIDNNVFHIVDPSATVNQADVTAGGISFNLSGDSGAPPIVVQNNIFRQSAAVYRVLGMMSFSSGNTRRVQILGNDFAFDHTLGGYAWAARMTGAEIITIQGNTLTYGGTAGGGFDIGSDGAVDIRSNTFTVDATNNARSFVELRTGQSGPVTVRNNVYAATNNGGTARFIQTSTSSTLNVDHNTMVLTGTPPSIWNLVYRASGNGTVRVRNNIAHNATGGAVGQPIYATDATGFEITANLFRGVQNNFSAYYLGTGVGQTTADLNLQSYASGNIEVDPQLDAAAIPVVGTSPDAVITGGINDDSSVPGDQLITTTDRNGATRTVPVTLGAYEVDSAVAFAPRAGLAAEWLGPPALNMTDSSPEDGYTDTLTAGSAPAPADRNATGDAWSHVGNGTDVLVRTGLNSTIPMHIPDQVGEQISLSFWMLVPGGAWTLGQDYYVASWNSNSAVGSHLALRADTGGSFVLWAIDGGSSVSIDTGIPTTAVDTWHHIVVNWERTGATGGTIELFANGVLVTSQTIGMVNGGASYSQFNLARRPAVANDFVGGLDDVRVYSRSLISTEVDRLWTE